MAAPERSALLYPGYCDIIDISKYQGRPDFVKVKASGFLAVVVKVSDGLLYCDAAATQNLEAARDAGLYTMVYSFAQPGQGRAAEQVKKMYSCLGDQMPHRTVMDLESGTVGWSPQARVDFAEQFVEAALQWSALTPMMYTFPSFAAMMQPALSSSTVLAACPLWVAQYRSVTSAWVPPIGYQPTVPRPWTTWTMHQYSGDGGFRVPGVTGDCDRNLFNGDEATLRDFFGLPISC